METASGLLVYCENTIHLVLGAVYCGISGHIRSVPEDHNLNLSHFPL